MEDKEIPKVVINFQQVDNTTQINEVSNNLEIAKDFIINIINSFWSYFFKGTVIVAKVIAIPAILFFTVTLFLLSLYYSGDINIAVVAPFKIIYYAITITLPNIFMATIPLYIIYGILILCSYLAARGFGKVLYKNNKEKSKKATKALFITHTMLALNNLKKELSKT